MPSTFYFSKIPKCLHCVRGQKVKHAMWYQIQGHRKRWTGFETAIT